MMVINFRAALLATIFTGSAVAALVALIWSLMNCPLQTAFVLSGLVVLYAAVCLWIWFYDDYNNKREEQMATVNKWFDACEKLAKDILGSSKGDEMNDKKEWRVICPNGHECILARALWASTTEDEDDRNKCYVSHWLECPECHEKDYLL
jgi:4-amino-4-deoxy-L-arabinose transferase-like glycosyltransferase